jgi:hypothetical protein
MSWRFEKMTESWTVLPVLYQIERGFHNQLWLKMADHGGDVPENAQDLTIFVQNLLEQMVRTTYQLGLDAVTKYELPFLGSAWNLCSVVQLLHKFSVSSMSTNVTSIYCWYVSEADRVLQFLEHDLMAGIMMLQVHNHQQYWYHLGSVCNSILSLFSAWRMLTRWWLSDDDMTLTSILYTFFWIRSKADLTRCRQQSLDVLMKWAIASMISKSLSEISCSRFVSSSWLFFTRFFTCIFFN